MYVCMYVCIVYECMYAILRVFLQRNLRFPVRRQSPVRGKTRRVLKGSPCTYIHTYTCSQRHHIAMPEQQLPLCSAAYIGPQFTSMRGFVLTSAFWYVRLSQSQLQIRQLLFRLQTSLQSCLLQRCQQSHRLLTFQR